MSETHQKSLEVVVGVLIVLTLARFLQGYVVVTHLQTSRCALRSRWGL
jgi:hypothetical protein